MAWTPSRNPSNSKKKPPTSSCVRYESHQQSEDTTTRRDAEIAPFSIHGPIVTWTSSLKTFFTARAMTCDAEWRSLTISSSAFVGNFAASISSWLVGMCLATVSGARRRTSGARARAERRTPASNMARRIGLAVACAACAQLYCLSVSPFQLMLTQRSLLPRQYDSQAAVP